MNTAPVGIDQTLWNIALLVTQLQTLQAQATAVTPTQVAAFQAAVAIAAVSGNNPGSTAVEAQPV